MGAVPDPRWPVAPLMEALEMPTPAKLARLVHVDIETVEAAIADGLTTSQAEQWCRTARTPGGTFTPYRCAIEVLAPGGKSSHQIRRDLEAAHARELAEAQDLIEGVIAQACERDGVIDSSALGYYADAMHWLADRGRIAVSYDAGRRVVGRWVER